MGCSTTAALGTGTVAYGYDAAGNRTSQTVNGVTRTNTFDLANRMTASGSDAYTYEANGNQTSRTSGGVTTTYAYDKLDRLTAISGGGVSASYTYNGDGLRVAKTVGGVTTRYAWDPTGLGVVLADGAEYVWGAGLISQITSGGTQTYAHADGLGSIRLLTDAAGAVVGSQQYDAFGGSRAQSGAQLPFGFTGEQTDAESGLVYLRARFMDPATGRFLSRDAFPGFVGDPGSLHAYAYVQNSPLQYADPSGHFGLATPLVTGAIGAVAGVVGSVIGQTIQNDWNIRKVDWQNVAIAGGVGFAAGAAAPFTATTALGAVVTSAAANLTQYGLTEVSHGRAPTVGGAVIAGGTGGLAGGIAGPFTPATGKLRFDPTSPWLDPGLATALNNGADNAAALAGPNLGRNLGGGIVSNLPADPNAIFHPDFPGIMPFRRMPGSMPGGVTPGGVCSS